MKNFTKQITNKTLFKPTRWLLMALMLLVGTSSAWAQTWCLAGSFNGWSDAQLSSGKLTVDISSAGEYEFKIKQQGTWDGAYSVDGSRMERNNCSDWQLYTNKGNSKFYADVAGSYTFTFNSTSKKLSITYPAQCSTCCNDNYVAGDESLTGYDWNPAQNEMACENNLWSKTFESIPAGTYQFKVTNGSWNWSTNAITSKSGSNYLSLTQNGGNIEFTTTAKYDITIYFDNSGCYATYESSCASTSYSLSFADDATSVNKGSTLQASVSPNTGIGAITWSSSASSVATVDEAGLITGVKGGEATITAAIEDGDTYCGGSANTTITVKESPTISISAAEADCGADVTLTATIGNLSGDLNKTITWYKDETQVLTGTSTTYTAKSSGNYTAKITGTYINEATSDALSVTILKTLSASDYTLSENSIQWTGDEIAPTITPATGIPAPTTIKYGTSEAGATTTAPTAVGTYHVYISTTATATYCAVTDLDLGTFQIVCPSVDKPTIENTTNVIKCGENVTTEGSFTFTKVTGLTYTCDGGTVGDGTVTGITAARTYTLTAENSCGSSNTASVPISETQNKPTISPIEGDQYLCAESGAHTYSIDAIDGATYLWSISGDGLALGEKNAASTTVTPGALTTRVDGVLTITVTKNGCPTSKSKDISLIPLPTISSITPPSGAVCTGTTIGQLESTLTINKSEGSTTLWKKNLVVKNATDPVEQGIYSINTVSTEGCISSSVIEYTVTQLTTVPAVTFVSVGGSICEGDTWPITVTATNATSYRVYDANGNQIGEPIQNSTGTFIYNATQAGTYKFKAENNCGLSEYSEHRIVTVNPTPDAPTFTTSSEVTCSGVPVIPTLSPPGLAQGNYLVWYSAAEGDNKIGTDGKTLTSGANNSAITYYAAVSNGSCESTARTPYTVYVESTDITNLRLYLVDELGAELPANHVYCQDETVKFKLSYNGGKYTAYSWNKTVQANYNISGSTSLDKDNNTGAGSFTLAGVQSRGTITITLTSCSGQPITSNELNIEVAPVPVIESVTASKPSAMCYEYVTLTATTSNLSNGVVVRWYEDGEEVGSGNTYSFTKTNTTDVTNIKAVVQNSTNCALVEKYAPTVSFTSESGCAEPAMKQGGIVYLVPGNAFGNNERWTDANAWFAAVFSNSTGTKHFWRTMLDEDGDGTYACEVPSGYEKVIFCRMNPDAGNNMTMNKEISSGTEWTTNWNYKWNDTGEITYSTTKTKYTITGWGSYIQDKLDGSKTFRTVELNAGSLWVQDNAHFKIHAWSEENQNEGNWIRMVDANGDKIYHADVPTEFTHLVFGRFSSDPSTGYAEWEQTADLDITGGTRYVISKNGAYNVGVNAEGYWSWPEKNNSYDLGVSTVSAIIGNDNTSIICNAQIFKTSCAPAIWYGFQYTKDGGDAVNVEVGNTYVTAGTSYTTTLSNLEKGTYKIRARVKYANNDSKYGDYLTVIIANQCDANYEFAVGNTSTTVQACGGNRVLPALEIISDKNVGGGTITWSYEWKYSDGSNATNLSEPDIASPTFNGTASQTYKVRVIKKVNGTIKCTQTAEYQVVYDDNSPKGTIEAPATVEINQEVVLQGSIHNSEGFTWKVKEGDVNVTSLMLSDATILNPTFNTKEAGVYTITLTPDNNFTCVATPVVHTLTVTAPTENCGSNDIEVKFDFSKPKPSWFNGSDIHYTYKTNGGDCKYTYTGNDNKLNTSKPSFTIDASQLTDADFPITIYFIAQSSYNIGNETGIGYAKGSITKDDLGKLLTYNIENDANPKSYTKIDACIDDNNTKFEANLEETEAPNVSISAPTVTSPTSIVEGTATEATLMAYLNATGCSAITAYGFQYIQSDSEPTPDADLNTAQLSLPVTIGKSFKTTLEGLGEGVYWFRGYATNQGGKTGYTAWTSFTIITDGPYPTLQCNSGALQLLANGKIQVIVTNQGNEPVLQGSYSLNIVNQGATMAFAPLPVPEIAANSGTATFTTTNPVANKNNYSVTATLTYKGRKQQCSIKACTPQIGGGDTIFYTVDAAAVTDKCMLVFPTVYEAIDHLKASTAADGFVTKSGDGYMLKQPVVMQVVYADEPYKGNVRVGTTGGMTVGRPEPLIISLTNINNDGNSGSGTYHPLIIRAANPNAKPALQHIAIRKSRNITLDNLNLVSSETDIDNAIDIDNNNNNWVDNEIGRFANANVTVKNCLVKSKGFTCVHVSAVTKVYFINNEFLADLSDSEINEYNTRVWGASAKFIRCKDILFLRNNFTGTHATSVWLQEVDGALIMNNVFWNNNQIGDSERCAMIRLVQQSKNYYPRNIGVYYNTMYLADCDTRKDGKNPKFDFFRINNPEANSDINWPGNFTENSTNYLHTTVEFMYNNCYSYDDKTPGKSTDPFYGHGTWAGLCHNNFWSVKDQNTTPAPSKSVFAFGDCDVNYVNVKDNVCTTTASDPNSLVIKGSGLNTGIQPNTALALKLGADKVVSDRTREDIRPTTPTIIDPDDVPSGVVDAGGNAPSIALVVSDEAGKGTMTHTIDVVTYVGATRGTDYTAELQSAENFSMQDDNNGTVTISFNKAGKTQNLTYSDNLIVSKNNVEDIVIPITGKYVASYTGGWTLGAYQQTETIATDSIIWQGSVSDDWDNRNNWLDAKTKTTLTCVNTLAKDLKVIIPAPHSENYPAPDEKGIVTYPKLPAFDTRDAQYGNEIVNAGQGDNNEPTQFADHIYMEYGAALQGVENLVDDDVRRYNEATTHLTVDREKWFLVGNMVQPFTNVNKTETRLTISGDYYIPRQEPRVYMHQITVEENEPAWQHTFAELDVTIQPTEVFAISIPDLYGSMRFNAQRYYTYVSPNPSKLGDGIVPKSYTFNGRFINESEPLTFTGLSSNPVLVNNTYPCNLSASAIENGGLYTVYLYDHDKNSWVSPELDGSSKIKPQHGFAIIKKTGAATLAVTTNMLANGNTYHYEKSANATMPYHVIELYNANSTDGYASQIQVVYDAEKGAAQLDARDAEKLWSNNTMVPDLYMMMYDATLQRLYVEKPEMVIPLGVRLQQDMDVTFKMAKTNGIEKAILEDRVAGKEYDLTDNKEATITGLKAQDGNIEGRFFLNLVAEDQFNFDTPTDITDAFVETSSINIYVNNGNNLSVLANNVELQTIYVSDMSGRTQRYDVSGNYANITLPVSQGVYVVQVIGDNLTRTDKVIVK